MKSKLAVILGALPLAAALAAQPATTPGIPGVVAAGTPIERVGEGFEGTEGPLALPDGSLLFTENRAGRIRRVAPDGTSAPFMTDTNGSNGLALAPSGDLVSTQTADPAVGILVPPDHARRLADSYEGRRFNRPNDLVIDRQGGIYFTDPAGPARDGAPAPLSGVYRISPEGLLTRLTTGVARPNGIQLSPDERVLYVADSAGEAVVAFDISPHGAVANRRDFARLAGGTESGADGLAIDADGRLYVATASGVQVFDAAGRALGTITLPARPQNLAFAGPGKSYLYVVGRGFVFRIAMLAQGYGQRAK